MKVFRSLYLLFLLQNPASFLVACAPLSIQHHRLPATSTVKDHAVVAYQSFYDMCLRWRTFSTQRRFGYRVTVTRAPAAQMSQEQATELLKSATPRPTTVPLAMLLKHQDTGPVTTSNSFVDSRTLSVYVYTTVKVVVTSLRCRVGSVVAMFGWIGSSSDGVIVIGLLLSMMMQIMLVYWIWMDARAVCIWNPFQPIQASTLTRSSLASRSRMKCIAFNDSQIHYQED